MKTTGFIGTIDFMGLARPVRYEDASLTISNIGFAEAELVIKILEGLRHSDPGRKLSGNVSASVPEPEPANETEVKCDPDPEPAAVEPEPEPEPKKRGRKKAPKKRSKKSAKKTDEAPKPDPRQTDLEEHISKITPEPTPEPDPEPEPEEDLDELDDEPDPDEDPDEDLEDDDQESEAAPTIKITKEIVNSKSMRALITLLMDEHGLSGRQVRSWLSQNQDEIPVTKRLGHNLSTRLDRLGKLLNEPGLREPE